MEVNFNITKSLHIYPLKLDSINHVQFWGKYSSSVTAVLVSLVLITLCIVESVKRGSKQSKKRTVSKESSVPTASLIQIVKTIIHIGADIEKILRSLIDQFGQIFRFNAGFYNIVFLTNPAMLQKLFMSTEIGHLHKPILYAKVLVGAMVDGLTSSRAHVWKSHRSAISKAFTYNSLRGHVNIFEEHAKRFVLILQESLSPSADYNNSEDDVLMTPSKITFNRHVHMCAFEIIAHIAAGRDLTIDQSERVQFHNNFERCKELISYRLYRPWLIPEWIWSMHPRKWEIDSKIEEMHKYAKKLLEKARKEMETDDGKDDDDMAGKSLIEVMIKGGLSDQEIFSEVATFIATGHETVSISLNLLMFHFATKQDIQEKCRQEIDKMFLQMHADNSVELSMEALNNLTYLDMCIKEGLRLYPTAPLFGRDLEAPIQLDENITLSAGTIVFTSPWMVHRHPENFPDPERFDPERFSPENSKNRGLCEYMPFSVGPRNCVGYKSATLELKTLVSYVLHNFEVYTEKTDEDLRSSLDKIVWPITDMGVLVRHRQWQ